MGPAPVTLTKPIGEFGDRFEVVSHLAMNATPLSSFALPRSLVTELEFGFDEELEAGEDWDFVLRAALVLGVEDTGYVTSIHQRWADADEAPGSGDAVRAEILSRLDDAPLLLPPGSASELARLMGETGLAGVRDDHAEELEGALDEARLALVEAREALEEDRRGGESVQTEDLLVLIDQLERRARQAERTQTELLNSEFWRMTAPLRALVTLIRGDRRRGPQLRPPAAHSCRCRFGEECGCNSIVTVKAVRRSCQCGCQLSGQDRVRRSAKNNDRNYGVAATREDIRTRVPLATGCGRGQRDHFET